MGAALASAGPWAAFLGLCLSLVIAYQRDWIISLAEHKRVLAETERSAARAVEIEQRIGGYHEKRADIEAARADKAEATVARMLAELPPALHALAESKAGAA